MISFSSIPGTLGYQAKGDNSLAHQVPVTVSTKYYQLQGTLYQVLSYSIW